MFKKLFTDKTMKGAIAFMLCFTLAGEASAAPAFIHGHNVCALNVNKFRKWLGLKQTNSASATSFLGLRHVSSPKKGDVLVVRQKARGKWHVAVYEGGGMCWNPSSRNQHWKLVSCNSIWAGHQRVWRT